jgi:hypothetical protein
LTIVAKGKAPSPARPAARTTSHLFSIKVTRTKVLITANDPKSPLSSLLIEQIKVGLKKSKNPAVAAAVAISALHDHLT